LEHRIFRDDNGTRVVAAHWIAGNGSFDGYHLMATREGIHHLFLDEDDSAFDDDEIYAQATFVDADGGRRSQIRNVVTGRF
jgi:hypothetical protein